MARRARSLSSSSSSSGNSGFSSMFSSSDSESSKRRHKKKREKKSKKSKKARKEHHHDSSAQSAAPQSAEDKKKSVAPAIESSTALTDAMVDKDGEHEDTSATLDLKKEIHRIEKQMHTAGEAEEEFFGGGSKGPVASRGDNEQTASSGSGSDDDDDEPVDLSQLNAILAYSKQKANEFQEKRRLDEEKNNNRAVHLATQLLTPVSTSMALVVADQNATDESFAMNEAAVKLKIPPPSAEDAKKILKLKYVDHSQMEYRPFERDFYIPPSDVKAMREEEVQQLLHDLDGAQVKGREIPRPMKTWDGTGLPDSLLLLLDQKGFKNPFAVQCIGIPVLMSGRDLLVSAKTGSGKTLMYVLPMLRHVMHQRRCGKGEGPIGLVLLPTQELASQVVDVMMPFAKAAGVRVMASHGCVPLHDNINACKAGCDIMVAVPGRLLDLLTLANGKMLSFERVTFVVIDEVDRMFDSGFMEHTTAFLKNVRPDRQTAFVSATLPRQLKHAVTQELRYPIQLTVGGKPTPASNVKQEFEFFDEQVFEVDIDKRKPDERLPRLLQLISDLRTRHAEGSMMIFVQTKDECNQLFADLTRCGYRGKIALLYSGMEKMDREFALERFCPTDQFILVATGVAERGLDIAHLDLVVNYSMPDHYEAYVHRIGRTGRAGRSGHAVSFFTRVRDDDIAAPLVEGLERANQEVPEELYERASVMRKKRQDGLAPPISPAFHKGYGCAKRTELTRDQNGQLRQLAKAAGLEGFVSSSDDDRDIDTSDDDDQRARRGDPDIVEDSDNAGSSSHNGGEPSTQLVLHSQKHGNAALAVYNEQMAKRIEEARRFAESATDVFEKKELSKRRFRSEYPINDEAIFIRQKLQNAQNLKEIEGKTDTTIVRKGYYFDPKLRHSYKMKEGERPLYLLIHGYTIESVRAVFRELDALKKEAKAKEVRKWSSIGAQL